MTTAQSVLLLAVHILLISEFILAKRDYYDILGVPKDATERQIKKAFHKLALKYHPDRNKGPDAEAKFREIAEGKRVSMPSHNAGQWANTYFFTPGLFCVCLLEKNTLKLEYIYRIGSNSPSGSG